MPRTRSRRAYARTVRIRGVDEGMPAMLQLGLSTSIDTSSTMAAH